MTVRERLAEWLLGPTEEEKASTGIGATWMTYQPPLSSLTKDPRKGFKQAQAIGIANLYIRAAERVIGQRFATVPWHLEDDAGERIENDAISALIERPYVPKKGDPVSNTPRTRSSLWRITCRHLGLTGNAFWYLDQAQALDGFPLSLLYVNPARMTPAEDRAGNLTGWMLDADLPGSGVPLERDKVIHFKLEPADHGHYGIGLVESAFSRAEMLRLSDHHANEVLASGGRLAGVFSPPAQSGAIPDDQFQQLQRDIRTVVEQPDAARRSLILSGPIEFDRTSASPSELDLAAIAALGRDGILDLWGVPLSQLGGTQVGGLNSGEKGNNEEASLWQNAVGPRLRDFTETVQYQLLDRLEQAPNLVIEEPAFDDEAPLYDLAAKSVQVPLTNAERRAIIGKEPTGDPEFDDAVWLPISLSEAWTVGTGAPEKPAPLPFMEPPDEMKDEDEAAEDEAKARVPRRAVPGVERTRQTMTGSLRKALLDIFAAMRAEVSAKVERNAAHLATHPNDYTVWWDEAKWQAEVNKAIKPAAALAAEATHDSTAQVLGRQLAPDLRDLVMARLIGDVGEDVKGITETTRTKVAKTIDDGIKDGLGARELGKAVEESAGFGEYRSEMIARTETNRVLNFSQLHTYGEYGVERVEAIDGDGDPECAARNGQVYPIAEAMLIHDHPNGTLDWAPLTLTQDQPVSTTRP